jgi:uncharacterized membrane protein YphA (DoxX/SURF4 family)
MNIIRNIARLLIAAVFIFAGFVKLVDPLGLTYKFGDYFEAFHLGLLTPIALILSILMSAAELLIGLNLLLKIRMKETSWALLIFMLFFTLLTFFIALTDPVKDCGCFGDALILTNWQTFFKNIIFLIPTLIVFNQRNHFIQVFSGPIQWSLTLILFVGNILLSVYFLHHLPLIDFRPYKIGTHIPSAMEIPEGMPVDEYETVLVYQKNGISREFTLQAEEQPWNDSTWTWVETKNVLVKEGYKPPIHDFSLTSMKGVDITSEVLDDPGYSFLVIAYDLEKSSVKGLQELKRFTDLAVEYGYHVYGMSASTDDVIQKITRPMGYHFEFYTADDITLKTMIRSNPGLMLIKDGVIFGKWSFRDLPEEELLKKQMESETISELNSLRNNAVSIIAILTFALLGILSISFRLYLYSD